MTDQDISTEWAPDQLTTEPEESPISRGAMRVAGIFLFIGAAASLLTAALVYPAGEREATVAIRVFLALAIDVAIGGGLWAGWSGMRYWGLLRAGLGLLVYGGLALGDGSVPGVVMQLAFAGALALVLTGPSSTMRRRIAVTIYFVGYLLLFVLLFLFSSVLGALSF
jgi:hypothetical protein